MPAPRSPRSPSMLQAPVLRVPARARRARWPQPVLRDAAARPRAVGRGRRRARRRHAAVLRLPAMGRGRRSRDHPRRCRSGGAGAHPQARGRADRRRRADPAAADRRARRPQRAHRAHDEMVERQAKWRKRMAKLAPQIGYPRQRSAPSCGEDGILVDEVTQIGFAARIAYPVYKPRTFISPGYPGHARLGLRHRARRAGRAPRRAGGRRSTATAASCSRRPSSRPPCTTAFR